jgi:hypothetical protein
MAKHSKCSVEVISSRGSAFTSKRGAHRMIGRGLAVWLTARAVRMVETDPRCACEAPAANSARLPAVVAAPPLRWSFSFYQSDGFLSYPQASQESTARGLKGKYPYLGRRAA